jgi:hypothetical protein
MSATETNEPIKVAKWNGSKVKIALDDAVRDAVLKRGFVEDFSSTDIKLLATAVAIAVAGFGIYYRYVDWYIQDLTTQYRLVLWRLLLIPCGVVTSSAIVVTTHA